MTASALSKFIFRVEGGRVVGCKGVRGVRGVRVLGC